MRIEKPMKEIAVGLEVASAFPDQSLRNLPGRALSSLPFN
jgi:hypothetical protein